MGCPQDGDGERAAPPRDQPPIFSSCEEEETGRWAVPKRRTRVVAGAVQTCGPVPGAPYIGGTGIERRRKLRLPTCFRGGYRMALRRFPLPLNGACRRGGYHPPACISQGQQGNRNTSFIPPQYPPFPPPGDPAAPGATPPPGRRSFRRKRRWYQTK